MKVRNESSAPFDALEPGEVGEVDVRNASVKVAMAGGVLVPVEEPKPAPVPSPAPAPAAAPEPKAEKPKAKRSKRSRKPRKKESAPIAG